MRKASQKTGHTGLPPGMNIHVQELLFYDNRTGELDDSAQVSFPAATEYND